MATKPKRSVAETARIGRAALVLALEHRDVLEPRLLPGLIDFLATEVDTLEGKQSDAILSQEVLREATHIQNSAASSAFALLSAARTAIVRSDAPAAARTAFGIQLRPREYNIESIVTALQALLNGAARYPDVARSAGLVQSDLDSVLAHKEALSAANAKQEVIKHTRKKPVAERNALQVRIEKAVDAIINAGTIAFVHQPELANRFRGLTPPARRRKASSSASPTTSPPTTSTT